MSEPVVEFSRPEAQRPGTHLVLMLHGFNSNEQDLMGLVPSLPEEGFTVAALRAPFEAAPARPGYGGAYRWFELDRTLSFDVAALVEAAQGVIGWIRENTGQYRAVSLLGFSQGMAVATAVVRHELELVRSVVGLSGFVAPIPAQDPQAGFFHDAALAARSPRLPFFYGRDQEDPVIPAEMVAYALEWLREETEVTKVLYAGMGHGVSNQEIGHVAEFLRHVDR